MRFEGGGYECPLALFAYPGRHSLFPSSVSMKQRSANVLPPADPCGLQQRAHGAALLWQAARRRWLIVTGRRRQESLLSPKSKSPHGARAEERQAGLSFAGERSVKDGPLKDHLITDHKSEHTHSTCIDELIV